MMTTLEAVLGLLDLEERCVFLRKASLKKKSPARENRSHKPPEIKRSRKQGWQYTSIYNKMTEFDWDELDANHKKKK